MATIDDVKKYWDSRPCNIRHSNKDVGTPEYFKDVRNRKYRVEPHIPKFASFKKYRDKDVLEIGCGIGTDAESFVQAGANYTGIDLSDESIEVARKRLPDSNIFSANIETWCSDQKYDLIYSWGVLHHTPNLHLALANVRKMLKPGGELKMMVYSTWSWKNMMIKLGLDQYEAQSGVPIAKTYTSNELNTLLSDFDLTISKDHIFQYDIDAYKNWEYKKTTFWEKIPEFLISIIEELVGWHLMVKAESIIV